MSGGDANWVTPTASQGGRRKNRPWGGVLKTQAQAIGNWATPTASDGSEYHRSPGRPFSALPLHQQTKMNHRQAAADLVQHLRSSGCLVMLNGERIAIAPVTPSDAGAMAEAERCREAIEEHGNLIWDFVFRELAAIRDGKGDR